MGITLAVAFVLAQAADLATWSPLTEVNPIIAALGASAPVVKVGLVAGVLSVAGVIRHTRYARPVLLVGIAAGLVGAWSNVLAKGV